MTETGIFSEIKENILNKMTFSYPQVDNIETVVCYRHSDTAQLISSVSSPKVPATLDQPEEGVLDNMEMQPPTLL